jgi:hypothetical protein
MCSDLIVTRDLAIDVNRCLDETPEYYIYVYYIQNENIIKMFIKEFRLVTAMHRNGPLPQVFHASLLRIHLPNDDRLFPGQMDTQVGVDAEMDGEWAVDKVLSHAGS